ncbi:magnesium transporter [Pseudomarimonas arenosa]|uniref:Magnesium transporter n=1 Tax=Pseudomarimonas arenosa TaxID=2774145 RepID=A0AAW3ZH76_9GAMM|nr:magnesium transporter [Pseudomarimonas arenosa]MBD8525158.1 magnesium transporter [Pseudomarimonas arenosa]
MSPREPISSDRLSTLDALTATDRLRRIDPIEAAELLAALPVGRASTILAAMPQTLREAILQVAPPGTDWTDAQSYPEGTVGRLLEDPPAVFLSGTKVRDAVNELRELIRQRLVVYLFVVDPQECLLGVVAFRELLYAKPDATLDSIMIPKPFALHPRQRLVDAMREVVTRHFPVYPVCEDNGYLVGLVRGQVMFEQQAFEISAQAGAMVGVEKEERLQTPWLRSFKFRHPWLLINLLTVFVAAAVVGFFEDTIDRIVVLAMFLPVMAGQCGNLGAQSLAVMLRGMTLGELNSLPVARTVLKEGAVGLLNGLITGLLAGAAMYYLAAGEKTADPLTLSLVIFVAMSIGSAFSGMAGALVPVVMKRLGADPATASTIVLSTATDVVSMGLFLSLAAMWVI